MMMADLVADFGTGIAGEVTRRLVGGVLEDVTEGPVAASRMSRLGVVALKACRPPRLAKSEEMALSQGIAEMLRELCD